MSYYTDEQVYRVLEAIAMDVESEAGDDVLVFCPYHDNHNTPAGEVSKTKGTFFCFSCGAAASLEKLVMRVSGRTYFEAIRLIKSNEVKTDITDDVDNALLREPDFVPFDELLVARLHQAALNSPRAMNYFSYRHIDRSVKKFSLGYSENQDMVTVPVHSPTGMLLGFVGRGVDVKQFKNSPKLPKSKTLFNLHRVRNEPLVFVVESSFDAIRLDQEGIPAVATLGAGVSVRQTKLLNQYFTTVVSVPDQDTAGREMDDKLRKALGSKLSSILLPSGAKDVGDLTNEQIAKLRYHVADPLFGVL